MLLLLQFLTELDELLTFKIQDGGSRHFEIS